MGRPRALLVTKRSAVRVYRLDMTDSTNEAAKRLFRAGEITDCACITAREQTAGRGTRDHRWLSPRDAGIYLSVVVRTEAVHEIDPSEFTTAIGAACVAILNEHTDAGIVQHGINDLYHDGRKLGGVLTEVLACGATIEAVIVGIGINVRSGMVRLPADDAPRPIALEDLAADCDWDDREIDLLARRLASSTRATIVRLSRG